MKIINGGGKNSQTLKIDGMRLVQMKLIGDLFWKKQRSLKIAP
jgi:hypothetical protein